MVRIRNKTASPVRFGSFTVSAHGTLYVPYPTYSQVIKDGSVQQWGLDIDVRRVDFKNVSVKDFGAKGDGVSDDTYQIQSAIDYVAGNGGGIVNFPIGVFVASTLIVSGNVMLVGESKVESIIRSTGAKGMSFTFVGGECGIKRMKVVV